MRDWPPFDDEVPDVIAPHIMPNYPGNTAFTYSGNTVLTTTHPFSGNVSYGNAFGALAPITMEPGYLCPTHGKVWPVQIEDSGHFCLKCLGELLRLFLTPLEKAK